MNSSDQMWRDERQSRLMLQPDLPVPLDEAGNVNARLFAVSVLRLVRIAEIGGVTVFGSMTRGEVYSEDEARRILLAASQSVPPDFAFFVGVGEPTIDSALQECTRAKEFGATGILLSGELTRIDDLDVAEERLQLLADAAEAAITLDIRENSLPLPAFVERVHRWSDLGTVVGLRFGAGSTMDVLSRISKELPDIVTWGALEGPRIFDQINMGARGVMNGGTTILPKRWARYASGVGESTSLTPALTALAEAITHDDDEESRAVGRIKELLSLLGLFGSGVVRPPGVPIDEESRNMLRSITENKAIWCDLV
jgi:dihydrodipicolinate synthase/N-acetylneuraminate lyase